ncbi:hypothetical protein ED733_007889 [Metarhizium rileyi]|uniref:ZN622/Rei1/Reh1 zinc finger C2H2-type domain-containing protein n=1 Tax=Metarhizium rileyi (strain RCEF 4871) TaxID=1649241 RepID=A0A5C6GLH9_METRR|nr:hypothetical protein ED733_007889 [Metarhizium rileyi]
MTDTGVTVDQLPLHVAIPGAPSLCRLCNVQLRDLQTWRAHVKSDGHVFKLRLKAAEPGIVFSPPSSPLPSSDANEKRRAATSHAALRRADTGTTRDLKVGNGSEDEPSVPDFSPGQCLFCARNLGTLYDSVTHMAATHGFNVPFLDSLAVDLETVVWYFHSVIYGYRECIYCGMRRNTVEGVQHHMVAKGHCRFDVSPETEEFYELSQYQSAVAELAERAPSVPVRLPSGKLISPRKSLDTQELRAARRAPPDRELDPVTSRVKPSSNTSLTVARTRGSNGSGEV